MGHASLTLAVLPFSTLMVASYALRLGGDARLGLIRAAVTVGAYAVVSIELLSVIGWLTQAGLILIWCLALAAATAGAIARRRVIRHIPAKPFKKLSPAEWLAIVIVSGYAISTFIIALAAEPNNYDSMAYHLPKVEAWARSGSVSLFPAGFFAINGYTSGAEYLLLHLRLLTGGDSLYNLIQWGAAMLSGIAVSRIAAQLGAGRLGQLVAVVFVWTAPPVILQATSTQNDLVTAAWCACVATFAIDLTRKRRHAFDVAALGFAMGLAWSSKSLGLIAGGLFLAMWFFTRVIQLRNRKDLGRLSVASAAIALVSAAIVGPFLIRLNNAYDSPLGPPVTRLHALETHEPAAIVVNGARLFQLATMTADQSFNNKTSQLVIGLTKKLGLPEQDPRTSLNPYPMPFPPGANEDTAAFPVHILAIIAAGLVCLFTRWRNQTVAFYIATCVLIGVATSASVKWQFYANRFFLPLLICAIPLAGLAIEVAVQRKRPAARVAAIALVSIFVAWLAFSEATVVLDGQPRPLRAGPTHESVLERNEWETVFDRQPQYREDYLWAAATIKQANVNRIGLVVGDTEFDYPMWRMLPDQQITNLISTVPTKPAPPPASMQAIVCISPPYPQCSALIPRGWFVTARDSAVVALPAKR